VAEIRKTIKKLKAQLKRLGHWEKIPWFGLNRFF
jgi:hypothetical protein